LRDLCGAHRREINILLGALRERVPLDLLAARNSVPVELLLTRLSKRLEDHLALTEEAARWAIDSWALALGIVSDAELEEMSRRRAAGATPRVEATPTPALNERREADPTAAPRARPPATPLPQSSPPPATQGRPAPPPTTTQPTTQPPLVSRPTGARPSAPRSPPARGGTNVPARQPTAAPSTRAPSAPQARGTGPLQSPSAEPSTDGRGRRRWRGCLVGCFLLILLCGLLFVGGPFVLNILREEQQQRNLESPPVQTR
jgi:hypothetical protein